jgi:Zn-dependent M28 family amino/carboxypeptidase
MALVLTVVLYVRVQTRLERRAIAAQAPTGADAANVAHHVDRAQLMRDLQTLAGAAFEGRRTGSEGGRKARKWVRDQMAAIGLVPGGTRDYLQPFSFTHRSIRGLVTPGRPYLTEYPDAANVIGAIAGTTRTAHTIVLSAHYDHLGVRDGETYFGADDDASGIAVLLAAARYFSAHPPAHAIRFIAFDAEELGLRGSQAFVSAGVLPPDRIAVAVNMDMVSRNDRNEIFAAGTYFTPALKAMLQDVQRRAGVKILFGHDRPMRTAGGVKDWTDDSDQGPFHDAGVPFLYFGVEDHPDYHRPTDTADKIDPRFFGDVADMVVETVRTLDARLPL